MPNQPFCVLLTLAFLAILNPPLCAQLISPETQARIAERDQLRAQAIELKNAGKLDQSKEFFERAYQMEREIFGSVGKELDGTLDILLRIAKEQQDDQAINRIRQRQHEIAEKRHVDNNDRTR